MERKITYKLFVDDDRIPSQCALWMHERIGQKNPIYLEPDWVIVRDYKQFTQYVLEHGLPVFVSFDHDLGDANLIARNVNEDDSIDYENSDFNSDDEKTGFHCVKWMVELCIDRDLKFPDFAVHTQNPIGATNMLSYIQAFRNFTNK